jgi:hypothetical protein
MPQYIVRLKGCEHSDELGEWKNKEDAKSDFIENNAELFEHYDDDPHRYPHGCQDYSTDDIIVEEYVDDTL